MEAYVVKFEDGSYWKGKGGKITKNLQGASFLRECDVRNKEDLYHIKRIVERYYGLKEPKVIIVDIEEIGEKEC